MGKNLYIVILFMLFFSISCGSSSPPSPRPSDNASQKEKVSIDESRPLVQVLRQAEKVRYRLRYFGEELKTTYKPEKQAALLANVRETVHPACQEMKKIIENEKALEHPDKAKEIESVCSRIDVALDQRDLEQLRPAMRDFTPAFERLETAAKKK
jgi:hypothetical protein